MAKKTSRRARKTGKGFGGGIGLGAEDDVVDAAFQETARRIRPESEGGAPDFMPDTGREPLASGGARRGEAKQLSEEEDDFEDGRSSSGLYSRSQEDQIARGDVGSRAVEARSGYLSVEGPEDTDVVEGARGEELEPPEDIEGPTHEHQRVVSGGAETSRPATPPAFEKSPGISVPDERYVEIARTGRARSLSPKRGRGRRAAPPSRRAGDRSRKGARKTGRKTYSQNA